MESLPSNQQSEWHPQPSDLAKPLERHDRDGLTPTERLEAARPQLEQLVTGMAPDIKSGRWDALLGDDVSGRLPTLVLRQVITRSYADQGRSAPHTYFIAMGQEFSEPWGESSPRVQQIKDYLASGEKPKRVLFVTDNIAMGGSIQTVLETMDELGIPSDVASVQEQATLIEQVSGHVPYSLEAAQALTDKVVSQGRFQNEAERLHFFKSWTQGVSHGDHDPNAKYYGVDNPIRTPTSQPFHLSHEGRPQSRDAMGIEKYGGPTTEGLRHHALRELSDQTLSNDIPTNPDVAELRRVAHEMADDLYRQLIQDKQKET